MDKKELRKFYKEARKNVSGRRSKEAMIADKLTALIGGAASVFCYESIGGEVSTVTLIERMSKRAAVFVPEVCGTNMRLKSADGTGYADKPCDVTIVPLIAFDETLNRIGFGGGFYDRYLAANKTFSVGIAFDEQQCEIFAKEPTDFALDAIVTPTRILKKH